MVVMVMVVMTNDLHVRSAGVVLRRDRRDDAAEVHKSRYDVTGMDVANSQPNHGRRAASWHVAVRRSTSRDSRAGSRSRSGSCRRAPVRAARPGRPSERYVTRSPKPWMLKLLKSQTSAGRNLLRCKRATPLGWLADGDEAQGGNDHKAGQQGQNSFAGEAWSWSVSCSCVVRVGCFVRVGVLLSGRKTRKRTSRASVPRNHGRLGTP